MAGWFFPGRGRAGGNGGGPRRPRVRSPVREGALKPGKNKWGWPGSSHIRPVSYQVSKGCTKCMPIMKSGTISPPFSELSAVSVRRLAWFLHVPMSKVVDQVAALLPALFSPGVVCSACKDNTKCQACAFSQQPATVPAGLAV
jgi:hypothetical protein